MRTLIADGHVYAIDGRKWWLPGLAGKLRPVHYIGAAGEVAIALAQPAQVIPLPARSGRTIGLGSQFVMAKGSK